MKPKSDKDLQQHLVDKGIEAEIIQLPTPVKTVAQAAAAIEVSPEQIVKSLLFMADKTPLLVIALGPERVEPAVIAQFTNSDPNEIKLCPPEQVLAITGYGVGTVPPLGHGQPLEIIVDQRLMELSKVYAGGGSHSTLLGITPSELIDHSRGRLVDLSLAGD